MSVKGSILKRILIGTTKISSRTEGHSPIELQRKVLYKLLKTARNTAFGTRYRFGFILSSKDPHSLYKRFVPIYDYDSMYKLWWFRTHKGEENVTWPGFIDKFALSSGTSGGASKFIPVSKSMLKVINRVSIKQMQNLSTFDLPSSFFNASILGVGGSTKLNNYGTRKEGDLSGIINGNIPKLLSGLYKPSKEITNITHWNQKIERMVQEAPNWNIGLIVGIPSWIQILLEKIIERYHLDNIHQLWPEFRVLVHGGVAFEPYRHNFENLLGRPIDYMETYLTSEGFLGYSSGKGNPIRLMMDKEVFFEFIPFTETNFSADGTLVSFPEIYDISEVQTGINYAIVISTCAGTWRYLLGDTIQFLDVDNAEIIITGRTKHYLTICGEHLSIDNMNKALAITCEELGVNVPEYCVKAFAYENLFAHKWYIGSDDKFEVDKFKESLDRTLCHLNDDYHTERNSALKEIFVEKLPVHTFYQFLSRIGKEGAQVKFPRVIKGEFMESWENFINP